ncbi:MULTISPECIES: helix-turn-helix domain-containing protein [Microcystis]|uniref:Helix-turn-helix domain-containing protein n=5 Tax=Microcystis TaxID=1125 RepID=A0ABR8HWU3_9CHRO|nr:helix-turn-helix domain-containing protein [Microcystis flos-aquae FACHB-1344]MCA2627325.1 helix-turn-helix domain-containing protein [Microcystis sp. M091S2]MCA2647870.1 helix-turn-helix domain-containing protein [Microcystis sp. M069S2]MCA2657511.1 helix-turn-helix domain-containing protein [Microcystis sp. M049S2]MCA2661857.1 helix-turn-helix domain-containing protein [Microcystis sp. M064S2]MCA2677790.1 helix-turn-helix domain-containing protein [Microcystis sp. M054S2]MCA2717145.1 hel
MEKAYRYRFYPTPD